MSALTAQHAPNAILQPHVENGAGVSPTNLISQFFAPPPPQPPLRDFTTQELQLSGACDWYKISRLIESENKLIYLLKTNDLGLQAKTLEHMQDDVLAHRMANSPFQSYKVFYRNNCANDAFIAKWRHEIDAFVRSLKKTVERDNNIPKSTAAAIVYQSQLLRQQAKTSLPYTGYYNAVPPVPKIPPGTFNDPVYKPQFVLETQSIDPTMSLALTRNFNAQLSSFL